MHLGIIYIRLTTVDINIKFTLEKVGKHFPRLSHWPNPLGTPEFSRTIHRVGEGIHHINREMLWEGFIQSVNEVLLLLHIKPLGTSLVT
jgi:hypothetical protein